VALAERARTARRPTGFNQIATSPQPPALTLVSSARATAQAKTQKPAERGPAMYVHYQLMKARQDELLRTAARHRPAAQARRGHPLRPRHSVAVPARRRAALRLRRLFS
jgi:hypothetical protein